MERIADVLLLLFIEIAEASQQKGETFSRLVNYLYGLFRRHPVQFLLLHSSFVYVLYLVFVEGIANGWTGAILGVKGADLLMKLNLFGKIRRAGEPFSTQRYYGAPDVAVAPWMRYGGAALYTFLLAMGVMEEG